VLIFFLHLLFIIGGESPIGTWTIKITDEISPYSGTFTSWSMEVQGSGVGNLTDRLSTGGWDLGSGAQAQASGMNHVMIVVVMMMAMMIGVFMF
jgi:subtilisin-like proprotein convertase family protein